MAASRNGREDLELNASQDGGRILTPARLETRRGRGGLGAAARAQWRDAKIDHVSTDRVCSETIRHDTQRSAFSHIEIPTRKE
eukprot:4186904-Prymnesium_polylepis.1